MLQTTYLVKNPIEKEEITLTIETMLKVPHSHDQVDEQSVTRCAINECFLLDDQTEPVQPIKVTGNPTFNITEPTNEDSSNVKGVDKDELNGVVPTNNNLKVIHATKTRTQHLKKVTSFMGKPRIWRGRYQPVTDNDAALEVVAPDALLLPEDKKMSAAKIDDKNQGKESPIKGTEAKQDIASNGNSQKKVFKKNKTRK